jgi:hypothetical protein
MKIPFAPLVVIAALAAAAVFANINSRDVLAAPSTETQNRGAIEGVWRVQMDGLPAVTLNVTYETGALNGAILFYLLRREPGQAETSSPGVPQPLIGPKFDGTMLTFAVSHRQAHPPASLNTPPVNFRMRLTGPGKAELINETESSRAIEILKDTD